MQPKPLSIFDSITHFYCLLLKILKVSEPFAFIMIFLSCCQNLSFIISSSYLIKILSDDLSQIIYQVLSIFRPLYIINTLYLPSLYRFILIVVMVYMVIYILIIILILYKDLKNSLNVSVLMKIFKRMTYMNFYLWYIPINELFMTPVYCLLVKKTDSIEELFSENLCIGGTWDIFLAILGVFFFGTMTITCLMNVLFCVDMTYNPDNALAKSDSLMELHTFVNKNLLIIQLIFLKYLQKPIFFLMFLVLLEINQIMAFREYTRKPNFFNMRVDKFYGIAISVELYVFSYILVFTVLNVLGSDVNTGMGLLLTILLPLRYFLNTFHNNYLKNLSIRLDLIKTPELIDKKLKLLFSYLISQEGKKAKDPKKRQKFNINYDKKDQTLPIIWGYLFSHYKYCVNMLCFCKNYDDKLFDYRLKYEYRPKQEKLMKNLESSIYLKYFIRQQYKDAISLHKQNLGLRLNLAYFNFFQLNNFHQALLEAFELNEASLHSKELNYRSLFLIKRLELEIRDFLQCLNVNKDKDESYSNFNIEAIQSFEDNYSLMEKKITEFRNLYTQFFIKLSNNSISFLDLEKECNILYNLRVIIQKTFDSLNTNPRAIKLYLGYLNNLVFKNDMGYNLEKKLKELLEKIHSNEGQSMLFYSENLLYNENSMLFQVGGEYKNLGKILRANQGSSKVLGYQKQELELSNISIIMPLRLSRSHDKFLEAFMKTGKNELLYKEKTMFTRKKNGYIISTALLIKPSFDFIVNQFKFLGYLRPLRKPIEYIVTDMYGSIDGMSENLSKLFNVHPKEYEKSIFYIQILCPKLYSFFLERNEKVFYLKINFFKKT